MDSDESLSGAIDELIANARYAPMMDDLSKAIELSKSRMYSRGGDASYLTILEEAERKNSTATKEFVAECIRHVREYLTYKMPKKVFDEGCDYLDEVCKNLQSQKHQQKEVENAHPT